MTPIPSTAGLTSLTAEQVIRIAIKIYKPKS